MRKTMIFIVLGCIMLTICSTGCKDDKNSNYWETIGITDNGLYASLLKSKGAPKKIEYDEDGAYVLYEGIRFYYPNKELNGSFIRAEIYSDKYVFGKQNITIGTRKDIIESYYKSKKKLFDLSDDELAYEYNYNTFIWFKFNENDEVNKIVLAWEMWNNYVKMAFTSGKIKFWINDLGGVGYWTMWQ